MDRNLSEHYVKVPKKGNITEDVFKVLDDMKAYVWMINTGMANYNSISRFIQKEVNRRYGYLPKVNTISTILRKIYHSNQNSKRNPFKAMKIEIITGLYLISCDFTIENIKKYVPVSRAIRIMPDNGIIWVMTKDLKNVSGSNIKQYGEYIEINIIIENGIDEDEAVQAFLKMVALNYIKISQLMISRDGFEFFIESSYFDNVVKLIENIRKGNIL